MENKKGKLFWKLGETPNKVYCIRWEEQDTEYYSFLKQKKQDGYRQVIISSEIFMSFLRFAVGEKGYSLLGIEFMEEDTDFNSEIDVLISMLQTNPACFAPLMDKLQVVAEKSSIEIKRVSFKSRINGMAVQFFIQSNGLIGVNAEAFDLVSQMINTFIEGCLF